MNRLNKQAQRRKNKQLNGQRSTPSKRGASESVVGLNEKLTSLLRHHKYLLTTTLPRLCKQPAQTLMTSLVIAIALGLPTFFYSTVVNLQAVGGGIESTGQMTVFLSHKATTEQSQILQKSIAGMAGIASVQSISAQQALNEFKAKSGFGEVLDLLDENPLPEVLLVLPEQQFRQNAQQLEQIIKQISAQAIVDDVLLDMRWLERLNVLLRMARNLALALGAALSLGVLLIVGNTIRLEIESRKAEIQVVKLIGGTNAYVRRPFLYTGIWYGAIGGVLAWLLVAVVMLSISGPAAQLASLYETQFELEGANLMVLIGIGAFLGLVGSYMAVGGHLSALDADQ